VKKKRGCHPSFNTRTQRRLTHAYILAYNKKKDAVCARFLFFRAYFEGYFEGKKEPLGIFTKSS